jgi:hypothetical protein
MRAIKGYFVGCVLNKMEKQDPYTVELKMDTETWNNVALKYSRFRLIGPSVNRGSCLYGTILKEQNRIEKIARVFFNYLGQEKLWKSKKVPKLLQKVCADIYSGDETGLFYRATPDGSLCYEHVKLLGSKKAMDRITVLCCSNMSGTDKKKLLVIGKSAKPWCFKGLKMDSLLVEYYANKNAWMTSEVFKKWLMR